MSENNGKIPLSFFQFFLFQRVINKSAVAVRQAHKADEGEFLSAFHDVLFRSINRFIFLTSPLSSLIPLPSFFYNPIEFPYSPCFAILTTECYQQNLYCEKFRWFCLKAHDLPLFHAKFHNTGGLGSTCFWNWMKLDEILLKNRVFERLCLYKLSISLLV